jgi:hypothetical protein
MKRTIIVGILVLTFGLFVSRVASAQGSVTYISNLGQASTGSIALGSNLWIASAFRTGANVGGYALDSIQLEIVNASGNPSAFTLLLYSALPHFAESIPGSSLETLGGSADPATGGIYNYAPNASFTLAPSTVYFIVLTAGTAVSTGAYDWSVANTAQYNQAGGWVAAWGAGGADIYLSVDGLSWNQTTQGTFGLYAIDATAIPEPGVLSLFGLGGVFLFGIFCRRRHQRIGSR